jgi:hypothetical protein
MPLARDELDRILGSELSGVVQTLGLSLIAAAPLAGDGYPGYQPSAFRLETADGRTLKGRVFATVAGAEEAEYVAVSLPAGIVPPILLRAGAAMVTEWADGVRPEGDRCTPALLRQCGAVHATVHLQPLPEQQKRRSAGRLKWRSPVLAERAAALGAAGVLSSGDVALAIEVARQYAPQSADLGLSLGDFCPENAIVRDSGQVCFIDHETLAIEHCDYDLARTWYRWPMSRVQRSEYLGAYAALRPVTAFLAHFPHWAIGAMIFGAAYRLQRHRDAAAVPAARLRALLAELDRGVRPEDVVYGS